MKREAIPEETMAVFDLDENCDIIHGSLHCSDSNATPLRRCYGYPDECEGCEVMKKH